MGFSATSATLAVLAVQLLFVFFAAGNALALPGLLFEFLGL